MKRFVCIIAILMLTGTVLSGCMNAGKEPVPTSVPTPVPDVDPALVDTVCEKWVMQEVEFQAQNSYENPFYDVTLDVEYTAPSGKVYTVPAFWDGDNIWKVRFAPTEEGIWQYKTTGSSDPGLMKEGTLGCNTYKGELEIYKHGFITVKEGDRFFSYADGTPFFYLGDTHWTMLKEEIDSPGSNASDTGAESHFKYIVDARVEQGFTVYQSEPIDNRYNLANGFDKNDIRGFQKVDEYFAYIAQKGLVHANAQLFFTEELCTNYSKYSVEYLRQLTRYWVARYSAYPVMWTTAQEADDDFFAGSVHSAFIKANNPWKVVTSALHEFDPYSHPLSCHTEAGVTAANSEFINIPGYNWVAAQTYVKRLWPQDFTSAKLNYYSCNYPVVLYEGNYENLWTTEFGARVQGWAAYLNGMCGYGYGVGDIWYYKSSYDMTEDTVREETITVEEKNVVWGDMIHNANSVKLGYIKKFLQQFEWWRLTPCFDEEKCFVINNKTETFAFGSQIGQERIAVYVYNKSNSADITLVDLDDSAVYTARWFDANTGEYLLIGDEIKSSGGRWSVKEKPSETDYVLELIRK